LVKQKFLSYNKVSESQVSILEEVCMIPINLDMTTYRLLDDLKRWNRKNLTL